MLLALLLSLIFSSAQAGDAPERIIPPVAARKPHVHEMHGHKRADPYFWMKERESAEVLSHLKLENEYTEKMMESTKGLQALLFKEMRSRIKEDDSSVPYFHKGFFYYQRNEIGKQYSVSARKNGSLNAKEQILVDENNLAKGHKYFNAGSPSLSPNQKLFALATDTVGRNFFTLRVKDIDKNEWLPFQIENTAGSVIWAADNETFFYTKQDPTTLRTERVIRFNIRTGKSEEVFHEKDETFRVGISASRSDNYLFIYSSSTLSNEIRYLEANKPLDDWRVFLPRESDHRYDVEDGGDRFFVQTNWNAKNYRLMETGYENTGKESWKEVIPHRNDVYLEEVLVFKNFIKTTEKKRGLNGVQIYNRGDYSSFSVPFLDKVYETGSGDNPDFSTKKFRYTYASPRTPTSTFDFDIVTRKTNLLKVKEVPGYNQDLYKVDRIWISARDGTKVPVNLLMKKNERIDGKSPILVYAYGSYGYSLDAGFSSSVFNLVNRGFVYAEVGVRGGSDLGRQWYDDGRTKKKMNTFYDFIDATESLLRLGYGHPKRVYANGGSAGGLLMGGVMNIKPELYTAIAADVPFVDVITTMLDTSIPLTTGEYDEWGNPNIKEDYDYILQYSPYDNVVKASYPYLLATTGLQDTQVPYWEPAKWVAKVRDHNIGTTFSLLQTNLTAGHGGSTGRFDALHEVALRQSFFLLVDKLTRQTGGRKIRKRQGR